MPTFHNVVRYDYQINGGPTGYMGHRAIIRLYDATDYLAKAVAYIYFIPEGRAVPNNTESELWIKLYLPESQIPAVVDMLRNEKPVSVFYNNTAALLFTGKEPVGEAEAGA